MMPTQKLQDRLRATLITICSRTFRAVKALEPAIRRSIDSTAFKVIERLAALVAVLTFVLLLIDRNDQADFQAWSLIDMQAGKFGNGGQTKALERIANGRGTISSIYLPNTDMSRLSLTNADVICSNFDGALLIGSRLSHSAFRRTTMKGAEISRSQIQAMEFSDVTLSGANLSGTKIRSTVFEQSDLSGVALGGTTLDRVEFRDCDLKDAFFGGATFHNVIFTGDVSGVSFRAAEGLTQDMFRDACARSDSPPGLPPNISISQCFGGDSTDIGPSNCEAVGTAVRQAK
jgi:uncharacterized protein YjbI with pentapeptide repeats